MTKIFCFIAVVIFGVMIVDIAKKHQILNRTEKQKQYFEYSALVAKSQEQITCSALAVSQREYPIPSILLKQETFILKKSLFFRQSLPFKSIMD
ncbi:MAG: hypothetical protein KBB91_01670 [Candidatus Pacebacteria bacterium]|jgi:hypothetical protein|nr:hypothetical protein [Candidatus Paceibacterota bacterium]MBP9700919.1 hypothetical protein [Candidatus Paceibacterota bacterium]